MRNVGRAEDERVTRGIRSSRYLRGFGAMTATIRLDMAPVRFTVFRFVITHFGRLRNQFLLTQVFDAALAALTVVTAPNVTAAIRETTKDVLRWPEVTRSRHRLGGRQFNYRGIEMGHIHSNGVADIRLNAREHDDVLARGLAQPHHVAPQSTWVTYYIDARSDAQNVDGLFEIPFRRLNGAAGNPAELPSDENG
jgi:hypothetical protein